MSIANEIQRLQTAKADIKSAIEEKGVTVGDGTIDTYASKISEIPDGGSGDYEQGFEDGKNSVVDYTKYITSRVTIPRGYIEQKDIIINLDKSTSFNNLFSTNNVENKYVEHITVNCPNKVIETSGAFQAQTPDDTILKHITFNADMSQATSTVNMFRGCQALEIIDGTPLDFSSALSMNIFNACKSVKEFRIVKESIKLNFTVSYFADLSAETIQSIIDGLATVDTAQTVTLHDDVKILQSQVDSANAKGWTVAGGTVVSEEEYYA
jgi:hypothetical protein